MKSIVSIVASLVLLSACGPKDPGLKDAYRDYFKMGVAVTPRNVTDSLQSALILKEFNSLTAENCMKPGEIHPRPGVWRLEQADAIADFCRANGLKMRGHCLVWHSQFANWMFGQNDEEGHFVPATKEQFYDSLRVHIQFVVNRYKDVVYCWDVVNEAMSDAGNPDLPYEQTFRRSRAYQLCGDEFILKAFQFAHEADPEAGLFYNDYSAWTPAKRTYIYNMVKKLKAEGAPITGIGMQGHYNIYDNPDMEDFEKAIQMYLELVDDIQITELDVRVNHEGGGRLQFSRGQAVVLADSLAQRQNDKYAQLFEVMRRYSDHISCVTFWNLSDRNSWLGANNFPLLFDRDFQRKPVYYTVRDF